MPSMKSIKRRITSVNSTKKIMKAMNMVAASKLQKAKSQLDSARRLFNETKRVMDNLKNYEEAVENIFVKPWRGKNTVYIVITSDRGLCGGFNVNVAEKALSHMRERKNEKIIAIGLKGRDYFQRNGKVILHSYAGMSETAFYEDAERIGEIVESLYKSGEANEVYLAYTQFESVLACVPRLERILPVSSSAAAANKADEMKYDPDLNFFLNYAVPMYLNAFIYAAFSESLVCEHATRMVSMDSSVNNASDIIDRLTHMYNRRYQASITQEISEIVGGINILT